MIAKASTCASGAEQRPDDRARIVLELLAAADDAPGAAPDQGGGPQARVHDLEDRLGVGEVRRAYEHEAEVAATVEAGGRILSGRDEGLGRVLGIRDPD